MDCLQLVFVQKEQVGLRDYLWIEVLFLGDLFSLFSWSIFGRIQWIGGIIFSFGYCFRTPQVLEAVPQRCFSWHNTASAVCNLGNKN